MENITVKKQLRLSLPMAFVGLINVLMTLIDLIVVSRIGINEIGAIGAMTVVIDLLVLPIDTINISNIILISRNINEKEKFKLFTGNSIILSTIMSCVLIIMTIGISPIFPSIFNVSDICNNYLSVRLIGFMSVIISTILSSHQIVLENQHRILLLRVMSLICNLIFNIIAVFLGYGLVGIAWVTVLIDTICSIYLIYISRNTISLKINRDYISEILTLFKWNIVERLGTRIDKLLFNIIVSRMGNVLYSIHIIVIEVYKVYEKFIQEYINGITISFSKIVKENNKERLEKFKKVSKILTKECNYMIAVVFSIILVIVINIVFADKNLINIAYSLLPFFVISGIIASSGGYYFSILRGMKEFKFFAIRNTISSVIKITIAFILSYTFLEIYGIWFSLIIYQVLQYILSKKHYNKLLTQSH